jgi:hypothetical protein
VNLGYDVNQYLTRYCEIKTMIDELTTELNVLKPNIVSIIESQPGEKIKTETLSASITKRKVYKYSDEYENLKQHIKVQKKYEEENGIAEIIGYNLFPTVRAKR